MGRDIPLVVRALHGNGSQRIPLRTKFGQRQNQKEQKEMIVENISL